MEPETWNLKL